MVQEKGFDQSSKRLVIHDMSLLLANYRSLSLRRDSLENYGVPSKDIYNLFCGIIQVRTKVLGCRLVSNQLAIAQIQTETGRGFEGLKRIQRAEQAVVNQQDTGN